MSSPYEGLSVEQWRHKTLQLIQEHPLEAQELYEVVLKCWADIFESRIGSKPFQIGVDLFPAPQIMGFFLHELIPLELAYRYPNLWSKALKAVDKDIVYLPDSAYSVEIKTSSSRGNIYGNRSYAQVGTTTKKSKSGYYLTVNFEKFTHGKPRPEITLIRFGWLDAEDWVGQTSATGQQARLSPDVEKNKLLTLPISK